MAVRELMGFLFCISSQDLLYLQTLVLSSVSHCCSEDASANTFPLGQYHLLITLLYLLIFTLCLSVKREGCEQKKETYVGWGNGKLLI